MDKSLLQIGGLLDEPMQIIIKNSSPSNLPTVLVALEDSLGRLVNAGNDFAMSVVYRTLRWTMGDYEDRRVEVEKVSGEIREAHAEQIAQWGKRQPWLLLWQAHDPAKLRELVTRFGPQALYLYEAFVMGVTLPAVLNFGGFDETKDDRFPESVRLSSELLVDTPAPWLPAERWWADYKPKTVDLSPLVVRRSFKLLNGDDLAALIVICLPYLETAVREDAVASAVAELHPLLAELIAARKSPGERGSALRTLAEEQLPKKTEKLLASWVRNETSVIG